MLRHDFTEGIVKRSAQLLVPIGLFLLIVWMNQATFQRIDVEFGKEATLGGGSIRQYRNIFWEAA